jgi:thiol-disulfide isomerase/thioredoxin
MVASPNRTLLNNFLSKRSNSSKGKRSRRRAKGKPSKSRKQTSTVGKILPPLDVRTEKDIIPLMNRIKSGPITIILVYADWCSHCHSFKPKFDTAAKNRTLPYPVAYVEDSMLSMANEKLKSLNRSPNTLSVEGYPTVVAVSKEGQIVKKNIPQETSIKMMNEVPPMNKASIPSMETPIETPIPSMETPIPSMETPIPSMETPIPSMKTPIETPIPSFKPSLENLPMVVKTNKTPKSYKMISNQPIFESVAMKGGNPTVSKYLGGGLLHELSKTPYQLASFDTLLAKLKRRK